MSAMLWVMASAVAAAAVAGDPLVFLHISKTAGTTTRLFLKAHGLSQHVLADADRRDAGMRWVHSVPDGAFVWHHSPASACDADACWASRAQWMTTWRNPVERLISHYFYVRHYNRGAHREERRAELALKDGGSSNACGSSWKGARAIG